MRFPFFRRKDTATAPAARPSLVGDDALVQAARTQARRRLMGALVLLLIGVVGFPVLFETQPRPLPVDIPMLVPQGTPTRNTATPAVAVRPPPSLPSDAGAESAVVPVQVGAAASMPAPLAASAPASTPSSRPQAATKPAPPPASAARPTPSPVLASAPVRPASEPEPAGAAGSRFVVQVGAYNDIERLKAARSRLEKLGYRSYTQDVDSPTGKRTRVRVGPYASKQEAEAVAAKVKAAGMHAAILSL